jgi:hypothetical protein
VWDYGGNRQEPRISTIRILARERNLDAVVVARGDTPGGWGAGFSGEDPRNPVSLYLVNIETGRLFKRKGTFADVGHMAERLLAGFLATHPTVVATVTPIERGVASINSPKKIVVFPMGTNNEACMDGQTRPRQKEIVYAVRQIIGRHGELKFLSVYQPKSRREERKLWSFSGQPNTELVSQLGRDSGADLVLTAWRPAGSNISWCSNLSPPFLIRLYLVDVQSGRTFAIEGDEAQVTELTEKVLAQH